MHSLHKDPVSNERLNEQLAFYADGYGITQARSPSKVEGGLLFGSNDTETLFYNPRAGEVGVMKSDEVETYLRTGLMPGQDGFEEANA